MSFQLIPHMSCTAQNKLLTVLYKYHEILQICVNFGLKCCFTHTGETEVKTWCLFCPVLSLENRHSVEHRMDTETHRFTQGHTSTGEEGLVFGHIDSQPFLFQNIGCLGDLRKQVSLMVSRRSIDF